MSDTKKPSPETFEAEFEAFLREENSHLGELYRKLPHPEPDAAIDARMRARAHQALREDAGPAQAHARGIPRASRARMRHWLPAFGAAATLVLVAGLAWRLTPPMAPTREAAQISNASAPAAVPSGQAETAPSQAPAAAPVLASKPAPPQASADSAGYAPQSQHKLHGEAKAETNSAPTADATKNNTPSPANDAAPSAAAKTVARAATTAAQNSEASAFPRMAEQSRMQAAPPSRPLAPTAPPPARPSPAAAPPPPAAAAPTPPALEQETAKYSAAPTSAPGQATPKNSAETQQAFAHGAVPDAAAPTITPDPSNPARYRWEIPADVASGTQVRSGVYPPDPPPLRAWLEIIRAMLRDGRRDAARQALADLRGRHPDFRVPADLHGLE